MKIGNVATSIDSRRHSSDVKPHIRLQPSASQGPSYPQKGLHSMHHMWEREKVRPSFIYGEAVPKCLELNQGLPILFGYSEVAFPLECVVEKRKKNMKRSLLDFNPIFQNRPNVLFQSPFQLS